MKITQVQTRITSPVSFGAGNMNNITPNVGLLSLQNSDKLSFEKDLRRTQNADAVQSNPLKAIIPSKRFLNSGEKVFFTASSIAEFP